MVALYARSHHPSLALLACLACLRVGKACGRDSPISVLSQFQVHPSPPGFCRAFVILFWKSCKCPKAAPGVHTKTHLWLSTLILVRFAAVIRVVTQRSSPQVLWGRELLAYVTNTVNLLYRESIQMVKMKPRSQGALLLGPRRPTWPQSFNSSSQCDNPVPRSHSVLG